MKKKPCSIRSIITFMSKKRNKIQNVRKSHIKKKKKERRYLKFTKAPRMNSFLHFFRIFKNFICLRILYTKDYSTLWKVFWLHNLIQSLIFVRNFFTFSCAYFLIERVRFLMWKFSSHFNWQPVQNLSNSE